MTKYHVTNDGKTMICKANVRACKYGNDRHFDNKDDAKIAGEKVIASNYQIFKKNIKKEKLPEVIDNNTDFSTLTSSERADYAIFQGFKEHSSFGTVNHNQYYGYSDNTIDDDLIKKLCTFGIPEEHLLYGRRKFSFASTKELLNNGYTIDYVKGSFKDETTVHFAGTFTDSNVYEHHVTAEVVITNPAGDKIVAPLIAQATFSQLLSYALDVEDDRLDLKTQNLILKEAMKKALKKDNENSYLY